jgi:hypothetical protein
MNYLDCFASNHLLITKLLLILCRVKFVVQAQCDTGQYVAIVGDRKALGSWDPTKSLPLSLGESNASVS